MLSRPAVTIESVTPSHGHEGTIVTLKGSGFAKHVRNNCVVVSDMGACARAQPGGTDTELKVQIGPVARETQGVILMWPGIGSDLHTERISHRKTSLSFSEVALFRNTAPVGESKAVFKLTKASPHTYAAQVEKVAYGQVDLALQEIGPVMRLSVPTAASLSKHRSVDICVVLKEPTLALDFSAELKNAGSDEDCLAAIGKAIEVNASLVGEKVEAYVTRDERSSDLQLYVTKPYLSNGMIVLRFS